MTGNDDPRIAAADGNFVVSFQKLVDLRPDAELHRIGRTVAFDCRIPARIFNGVAVLESALLADVQSALAWIRDRDVPFTVWVRDELAAAIRTAMHEAGLRSMGSEPVMALRPPAEVPEPPAGVTIREVLDSETLEDHIRSNVESGMPEESVRMIFMRAFLSDPDIRMFTAYFEGRPSGHAVAIRSGNVSGVYGVGVPEGRRRRGIGTAVTWAAVQAGRDWGCGLVVLQSSEMGFGVYQRMGFEVLTHYELFRE